MSQPQESQVQPLSIRQLLPQVNDLDTQKLLAALFDLLAWFRGDMRIGVLTLQTITAGNGSTFTIKPPDDSEEWEILYIMVTDTVAVDVADVWHVAYIDSLINQVVELQQSTLQAGAGSLTGQNIGVFPNRDTTNSKVSILTSVSDSGLIAKTKGSTPWLSVRVTYSASATVGTRSVTPIFIYKRRRLK